MILNLFALGQHVPKVNMIIISYNKIQSNKIEIDWTFLTYQNHRQLSVQNIWTDLECKKFRY